MDPFILIDRYCERTTFGFWNEPVNALSNVAFVIAALWGWREASQRRQKKPAEVLLIVLAGSIGVGSFLFHTFATRWAELADVIPIWSFVATYITVTIHRLTHHQVMKTLLFVALTLCMTWLAFQLSGTFLLSVTTVNQSILNGSIQYAPALFALVVFSMITFSLHHPIRYYLLSATLLFVFALLFRTIDITACTMTHGTGTHFLWHILSAIMIGVLLKAMISHTTHFHLK